MRQSQITILPVGDPNAAGYAWGRPAEKATASMSSVGAAVNENVLSARRFSRFVTVIHAQRPRMVTKIVSPVTK